jgi:hypothetical protein
MTATDVEPATPPGAPDAQQLDTAIRQLAKQAHIVIEALAILVEQAKAANIHETLGYPSWTAYIADALDGQWKLERDKRGEVVRLLASQGMSQRAIAATIGAAKTTVHRELEVVHLDHLITGLDGKTYPRPEPPEPSWSSELESLYPWLSLPPPPGWQADVEWLERSAADAKSLKGAPLTDTLPELVEVIRYATDNANQAAIIRLRMERWLGGILNLYATIAPGCDAATVFRAITAEAEALSQACAERIAVLEGGTPR